MAISRPGASIGENAAVFLLALVITLGFQWALGAYTAEFGNDDASHYVSGLLVHDYVLNGMGLSPLAFLKTFQSHYPLIGIGHWPPFYYFIEGVWMLAFSTSRAAALLLSATTTSALGALLYAFTAGRFGRASAIAATAIFALAPIVLQASTELMLDTAVALEAFIAMWLYVRYLEDGRAIHAALFGVAAGLALLTKGNAGALALFPVLVLLISRRFDLLRRWSFWLPLPIVGIIAGPWYLFIEYGASMPRAFEYTFGWGYTLTAIVENAETLFATCGVLVLVGGLAGLVMTVLRPGQDLGANARIGACALVIAVWVFQLIVPAGLDSRFLIPLLPPFAILAVWAAERAASAVARPGGVARAGTLTVLAFFLLVAASLPGLADLTRKKQFGLIAASEAVWASETAPNAAVLVVGPARFEATAVPELAMRDPKRPSLVVVRGARLLGAGGYAHWEYEPKFTSPTEVMAAIDQYSIPLVLFQAELPDRQEWAHVPQTAEARRLFPDRWELLYRDDSVTPPIELYRVRGNQPKDQDRANLLAFNLPKKLSD